MAKKSKVNSKKINHKNVLYVIGAVIVIVLLFTLVLKYTGKELAGKAIAKYSDDTADSGVLPVTITFAAGETTADFFYKIGTDLKTYTLSIGNLVEGKLSGVTITDKSAEGGTDGVPTGCTQDINCANGETCVNGECVVETNLPDLTISNVHKIANLDGTYTLIFTIINNGGISQSTYLHLKDWLESDLYYTKEEPVKELSFGETININHVVDLSATGTTYDGFTWVAEVDKFSQDDGSFSSLVVESDELNNKLTGCLAEKSCYNLIEQKQGTCNNVGTVCEVAVIPLTTCDNDDVCDAGEDSKNCPTDCALPDLAVLSSVGGQIYEDELITLTGMEICITNYGIKQVSAGVKLSVKSDMLNEVIMKIDNPIEPTPKSTCVTFTDVLIIPTVDSSYTIMVDPYNEIIETDETNNLWSSTD